MRAKVRWAVLCGAVAAIVVVFGPVVSFDASPPSAHFTSSALAAESAAGSIFESQPIEVDLILAGLTWTGADPSAVWVRVSDDGVVWSEWEDLEISVDHGPDPGTAEAAASVRGTDPWYFGAKSFIQYRVDLGEVPSTATDPLARFSAQVVDSTGRSASVKERVLSFFRSIEIGGATAEASPNKPTFVSREQWGADNCLRNTKPRVLPEVHRVETLIVHHAGGNDYSTAAEARSLIRAICEYHVQSRGWWDIAYNVLIDKFGNVYEGRRGGVENPIQGGHTAGFNYVSTGVALLGCFEPGHPSCSSVVAPPAAMRQALAGYSAWKLDLHHLDPMGTTTVVSHGSSKWPEGALVPLNRISGHKDATATACPGQLVYDLLPDLRPQVDGLGGLKIYADFGGFDPIKGPNRNYSKGTLGLAFTQPTSWNMTITRRFGPVVFETSGSGTSANVDWDGSSGGVPLSHGIYEVDVSAGAATPLHQVIQLGSYEWPFVDDEGSYAVDNIESLWNRGLTVGCNWSSFCPKSKLSRAEIAAFVARAMGVPEGQPTYMGYFTDVAEGAWYTPLVEYLYEQGIATDVGNGSFKPLADANRATVTVYVIKAIGEDANLPTYQGYFTDVPAGQWYTPYVERAYELEIALGYPDGTFRPLSTVTREESAAFLMRGLE